MGFVYPFLGSGFAHWCRAGPMCKMTTPLGGIQQHYLAIISINKYNHIIMWEKLKSGQTLFLTFWRGWDWSQILNTLNGIGRGTSLTACFQLSVQFAVFLTVLWTMPCSSIDNHMLYVVQAQPVWRLCLLQFYSPASIEGGKTGNSRSIAQKNVQLQDLIHNSIWTQIQIPQQHSPPPSKKKR